MIIYEDCQPKRYKVIFRFILNRFHKFLRQLRCICDLESIIGVPGCGIAPIEANYTSLHAFFASSDMLA